MRSYRVVNGDSLSTISRKFGCSLADLLKANGIASQKQVIRPGQRMLIPGSDDKKTTTN